MSKSTSVDGSRTSPGSALSVDELLRLACLYADQDREAFLAAYENMGDDPAAIEASRFLEQLRSYRRRRWGRSGNDILSDMDSVPVSTVIDTQRRITPKVPGRR